MYRNARKMAVTCMSVLCVSLAAGCAIGGEKGNAPTAESGTKAVEFDTTKLVTVKVVVGAAMWSEEQFNTYAVQPVKKKYPNITLEYVPLKYSPDRYQLLLASGEKPDLIIDSNMLVQDIVAARILENMESGIKAHKLDLSGIEPSFLDAFKIASGGQFLGALPLTGHFNALYYNKDLFDKFGVTYPKDGMNWNEVIELARKLTRTEGEAVYRGLDPDMIYRTSTMLAVPLVDAVANKPVITSDRWKQLFQMYKSLYDIPEYKAKFAAPGSIWAFTNGTTAMYTGFNILPQLKAVSDKIQWDMVTIPSFPEAPNIGQTYDALGVAVASVSQNKDAAYKVIEVLLAEDTQLAISRDGTAPAVKDKKIRSEFGKNVSFLSGKNVQSIFKTTPAKAVPPLSYDSKIRGALNTKSLEILRGQKDINTGLAELNEEMTKIIAEESR